jgi:hypothetical protein
MPDFKDRIGTRNHQFHCLEANGKLVAAGTQAGESRTTELP